MPAELPALMPHADIQTMMKLYVGENAAARAESLWAAYDRENGGGKPVGNTGGNTRGSRTSDAYPGDDTSP
jgi:hypothetical protein